MLKSSLASLSPGEKQLPKPKTLFNGMLGTHRVVEGTEFEFKQFNQIRTLVKGCTINDVVLAICGGALRDYLIHRGELPEQTLIAGAPVNLNPNRKTASDNDISLMQLPVQSNIADPLERLQAVYTSSSDAKKDREALGSHNMGDLSKQIPAPLLSLATNVLYKTGLIGSLGQLFNLVITNVPGSRQPLYFCGAQMKGMYGFAPLAHTVGLAISQVSYNGKLYFGVTADRDSIPDPEVLIEYLNEAFEQYLSLLNKTKKRPSSTKKSINRKRS